jgi:hypothetical protein
VKLGLPIYVNARSVPFLTSLVKRPAKFMPVRDKVTIGTGVNRIALYPVGGPYGEQMTMAYFPERRLLYGADLIFKDQPTPAADLRRAVEREHLAVDSVFCVQRNGGPFPWSDYAATSR